MNKTLLFVLCLSLLSVFGCKGDASALSPSQEKASRDAFHAKPDINTLSPDMRKRVDAMMAASKSAGPRGTGTAAPK